MAEDSSTIQFSGANWEDLNRLSLLTTLEERLNDDVTDDATKCAWLVKHFTGPALDWVAARLATTANFMDDYDNFIEEARTRFGCSDDLLRAHRRAQLESLTWSQDAAVFFAQFDRLTDSLDISTDEVKIQYLHHKLPAPIKRAFAEQALDFQVYGTMRERVLIMWSLTKSTPSAAPKATGHKSKKTQPKCHRCGVVGHKKANCPVKGES
jgi:hypothetical protein